MTKKSERGSVFRTERNMLGEFGSPELLKWLNSRANRPGWEIEEALAKAREVAEIAREHPGLQRGREYARKVENHVLEIESAIARRDVHAAALVGIRLGQLWMQIRADEAFLPPMRGKETSVNNLKKRTRTFSDDEAKGAVAQHKTKTEAAVALGVHPRTLRKRLNRKKAAPRS